MAHDASMSDSEIIGYKIVNVVYLNLKFTNICKSSILACDFQSKRKCLHKEIKALEEKLIFLKKISFPDTVFFYT